MTDDCQACGGQGGRPDVLDEADDFRIARGWVPCPDCGGSGAGEDQRRRAELRRLQNGDGCLCTPVLGMGNVERARAHNDECPVHGRTEVGK